MTNPCRTKGRPKRAGHRPALSSQARLTDKQIETLLRCYTERRAPKETAKLCRLSLNTVYAHYALIRERLVITHYYTDGALSFDEVGLAPEITEQLKLRRGIRQDDIRFHAAELIVWAEEWPPAIVHRHIRTIIDLTGPLDLVTEVTQSELEKVLAYVRYARVELTLWRLEDSPVEDEAQLAMVERAKESLDRHWRAYRAASKRVERERHTTRLENRRAGRRRKT